MPSVRAILSQEAQTDFLLFLLSRPREARDLIFKIRSYNARSDLKNKQKTAENTLFLRSDLTVQDRILKIRSLASLGRSFVDFFFRFAFGFGVEQNARHSWRVFSGLQNFDARKGIPRICFPEFWGGVWVNFLV